MNEGRGKIEGVAELCQAAFRLDVPVWFGAFDVVRMPRQPCLRPMAFGAT